MELYKFNCKIKDVVVKYKIYATDESDGKKRLREYIKNSIELELVENTNKEPQPEYNKSSNDIFDFFNKNIFK